ncbi:MAG: RsmD family RNA methyltransferase [Lentisphaeria bacterium]|nr:RsmD family RNA methyltransferase [Lentisphaeria bacterium]
MNIVAGKARGVELVVPEGIPVRPTATRVRKALFDSLGDMTGMRVVDLCAGSGALALEALNRGAAAAVMVELNAEHIRYIEENIRRVRAAGVAAQTIVIQSDAGNCRSYLPRLHGVPDIIFADPPYQESAEIFGKLIHDEYFCKNMAGAKLIWEIPDHPGAAGEFLKTIPQNGKFSLKRYAGTMFLITGVEYVAG